MVSVFWREQVIDGVLVRRGVRHGYHGSWRAWVLLPGHLTDDEARELSMRVGLYFEEYNSGPGQAFTKRATMHRTRTRVLVQQLGGLDI